MPSKLGFTCLCNTVYGYWGCPIHTDLKDHPLWQMSKRSENPQPEKLAKQSVMEYVEETYVNLLRVLTAANPSPNPNSAATTLEDIVTARESAGYATNATLPLTQERVDKK